MKKSLFAEENRLEFLSEKDPLVKIKTMTNWKLFEKELDKMFPVVDKPKGGRPSFSKLLLFKIVLLQEYYGLSDQGIEYQINDRLSFMRFLDLTMDDKVPDQNTIWNFKEGLKIEDRAKKLFDIFLKELKKQGVVVNKGSIVDASIVSAPIQRNSKEENDQIKNGETPDWEDKNKSHKDVDARWVQKHGKNYFGYKNHIKADKRTKIITACEVTAANVHDSQVVSALFDKGDGGHSAYMDSAYDSKEIRDDLNALGVLPRIQKKGSKNKPLTSKERDRNHKLSKTRCRVEHVFGFMRKRFKQVCVRTIGFVRAKRDIVMKNLVYNIHRHAFLMG